MKNGNRAKLEELRSAGITKWGEIKAHGVDRCCAYLYNRRTGKSRRCRCAAQDGESYCSKHLGPMKHADEMTEAAIAACVEDSDAS